MGAHRRRDFMSRLSRLVHFRSRALPLAVAIVLVAGVAAVAMTARGGPRVATAAAQQSAQPSASPSAQPTGQQAGDPPRSDVALPHSKQVLRWLANGKQAKPIRPSLATATSPVQGIDVAAYQDPINWPQVATDGYAFALIKATEGKYYTNPDYANDFAAAKAAGLKAAAYAFANPYNDNQDSNGTAVEQADYLVQNAGYSQDGKTLPLILDIENNPYNDYSDPTVNECYGLTAAQLITWIQTFITEIQNSAGKPPVIYTNAGFWNLCTGDTTQFSADPLWIADPSNSGSPQLTGGWSSWTFWQYASGTVNGTTGTTDLDYFNGDAAALNAMAGQPVTVNGPGSQSGTVGDPAWKTVSATDAQGGQPAYSATGLPPGLSINSSTGMISGWLSTPGSYSVTVTASDTNGSSSTTFPWQVNAASNTGPSGQIVLANGGKCIDDPGYSTADGTRLDIWSCVNQSNEKWTLVQDGTIRVSGACMDVSGGGTTNGTPVDLHTCDGSAAQQWQIGTAGELINPQSGRCLDDPGYATANGTKLDLWDCAGGTNERWAAPAGPLVSQIAPLCADDNAWGTANGNPIDVWACDGGGNEALTAATDGEVRVLGKCLDIYQAGTANGTPIDLYSCNVQAPNQQWRMQANGTLVNPGSSRCLDDPAGNTAYGTRLVIYDCNSSAGETWHLH
jgi:GH25 family lysozyme M1 (1,4-beta-N-acetylmuramidase)